MGNSAEDQLFSVAAIEPGDRQSLASKLVFLLLCVIPIFSTLLFGAVDIATWVFIPILTGFIVLAWIAESWNAGGMMVNTSWLQLPILGAIALGLVQLLPLGGQVSGVAVSLSTTLSLDANSTKFFVIKLIVYLVFLAACLTFINNEGRLKKIVWLTVIFGSLMAFYGILQRLATPEGIYGMRETSGAIPFGPFVNQHHFATFMQMTAGLALGLVFARESSKERRVLLIAGLVVMAVATISTSSRGGVLGFLTVAGLATLLSLLPDRSQRHRDSSDGLRRLIGVGAAAAVLIVLIVGTVVLIGGDESLLRGVGVVNASTDISTGRTHFWAVAWKIFLEHPIIGAGFEAFGVAFTRHDTWSGEFRVEQAHNEYLQTLADAGAIGFLLLAAFIVLLYKKGLRAVKTSDGFRKEAAIGALAGCTGVLVHSFFDFPLRTPSNAFFFLILCSIAVVIIAPERVSTRRRHRSTGP